MNLSCLKLLELLQVGDIETNRGPFYNLIKTVEASYHQAHIKFGDSADLSKIFMIIMIIIKYSPTPLFICLTNNLFFF